MSNAEAGIIVLRNTGPLLGVDMSLCDAPNSRRAAASLRRPGMAARNAGTRTTDSRSAASGFLMDPLDGG